MLISLRLRRSLSNNNKKRHYIKFGFTNHPPLPPSYELSLKCFSLHMYTIGCHYCQALFINFRQTVMHTFYHVYRFNYCEICTILNVNHVYFLRITIELYHA